MLRFIACQKLRRLGLRSLSGFRSGRFRLFSIFRASDMRRAARHRLQWSRPQGQRANIR